MRTISIEYANECQYTIGKRYIDNTNSLSNFPQLPTYVQIHNVFYMEAIAQKQFLLEFNLVLVVEHFIYRTY